MQEGNAVSNGQLRLGSNEANKLVQGRSESAMPESNPLSTVCSSHPWLSTEMCVTLSPDVLITSYPSLP